MTQLTGGCVAVVRLATLLVAGAVAVAGLAVPSTASAEEQPTEFGGVRNILPPGQAGGMTPRRAWGRSVS